MTIHSAATRQSRGSTEEDIMFELKPLSRDAVPGALERATRYRLLNEPGEAESICLDVLQVDPDNQEAIVILLLALTDRFGKGYGIGSTQVEEVLARLVGEMNRSTIMAWSASAVPKRNSAKLFQARRLMPMSGCERLCRGMRKPKPFVPLGNDDALLRWNACARMIMRNQLAPRQAGEMEPMLE